MGLKSGLLFLLLGLFMDPCDKKPRAIRLNEVNDACRTETGRMYVRVQGLFVNTGEIACSDHPGGRRCKLFMESESDRLTVLIRGSERAEQDGSYQSSLVAPKGTSKGVAEPYSVPFDVAVVYDRNGAVANHILDEISVSGSLQLDKKTQQCSLLVLHVESDK
jgi:hypothetical protein